MLFKSTKEEDIEAFNQKGKPTRLVWSVSTEGGTPSKNKMFFEGGNGERLMKMKDYLLKHLNHGLQLTENCYIKLHGMNPEEVKLEKKL